LAHGLSEFPDAIRGRAKKLALGLLKYFFIGKGEEPWEVTETLLCTEVYHCLPSELNEEAWPDIQRQMMVLEYRARYPKPDAKKTKGASFGN